MKARICALGIIISVWGVLTMPVGAAPKAHSDIITFDAPGADTTANNYNGTFPSGINDWGVIIGSYIDANNVYHGFLRSPEGKFTTFQAPGADTTPGSYNGTVPNSINNLGEITGSYTDVAGLVHGFLRNAGGKFTTFDVPGAGVYSVPIAVNLEGAVVGTYVDPNFLFHAFLRRPDGSFTTWVGPGSCDTNGSEGCYGSAAFSINIFGTIAGSYQDNSANQVGHGLVRSPGGRLTPFEVPGAGTGAGQGTGCPSCSLGLNDSGAIAGIYTDSNNVFHGYLRSPEGAFTTFDAPGAGTGSYQGTTCPFCGLGLNQWGVIAGSYLDANNVYRGFIRIPARFH